MEMDYTQRYPSPLGGITLCSDGEALTGLWFDGQKYFGGGAKKLGAEAALPIFAQAARWLDEYFQGHEPDFTPPLLLRGTPFRRAVWARLLAIPYGRTVSYGELARELAAQGDAGGSPRAVGGAVGHNPVSLIVPCHRVVGADGRLTGYAGGLERKARLLWLEQTRRGL